MGTITIPPTAGAMSSARPNPYRGFAAGASRQRRFGLTLWFLLLAGGTAAIPAAAQTSEGGAPSSSGAGAGAPAGAEAGPAGTGGGAAPAPAFPGTAPVTLPPLPTGGFGLPSPTAPPYSVNNQIPTLTSPPTLRLQPYGGVVPLQAIVPAIPAILIRPTAYLGEIFTDNVNYVHSPRKFAAITQLSGGISASVDTPRLQAVGSGADNGNLYLPSSNSGLNQIFGSLYANGHGTIYPDLLYVDAQSSISQGTTVPGFAFQNLST